MKTPSPEARPACASCRFQNLEQMQGTIMRQLVCHRRPPTMSMVATPQGIQGLTQFPVVQPAMWCHEWEPRKCDGNHAEPKCTDPGCWLQDATHAP